MSPAGETSIHVHRARGGDPSSTAWIVERFSPLLLAQARHRLAKLVHRPCDPEDLVDDVWAVALPRMPDVEPMERSATLVLARFLSTTLLNLHNNLVRKLIRQHARGGENLHDGRESMDGIVSRLPAETAGVVTCAVRREIAARLATHLERLPSIDRDVVVLRAFEQIPTKEVAVHLGLTEKAVSLRLSRALARLRQELPGTLLDDLVPDRD